MGLVHDEGPSPDARPRVLVVDDDPASRRGYELILRMSGYDVVTAADGSEALQKLAGDAAFDVIVSDVTMPTVDGYELTQRLRSESATRDLPIILVSAAANSARQVAGLDRGADDFLAKPVDADELLARIRMHLRHAARHRELMDRSRFDVITGTLNRRAIDDELDRELKRVARTSLALSVLMIDVDRFKRFNDVYGHDVGDAALRAVANKLKTLVRDTDHVGRYGGDEFLVVLPDTDWPNAEALMDRIVFAWRKHPPVLSGTAQPVFISVGSATASRSMSREALVKVADKRMYDMKHRTQFTAPG